MSNLNLKGIWIPLGILTDKKLSDKEKTIYAIIIYLSKENQYCFITNKTISELLNISVTQVSNLINSLKKKKYIETELIYKEDTKQVEMRKLIVKYTPQKNFNTPIKENFKDNKYNNKINNKYNSDNKFQKKSMANFEQRKYDDIDLTRLYANADAFI